MATIDRIRKLLALADDEGAADNEADVARRLAERLMSAAGLSEADVRSTTEGDPVATVAKEVGDKLRSRWPGILAVAVSRITGCYCYRDLNNEGRLTWIGTADQRATAIELYGWLCRQVDRLARGAAKSAPTYGKRGWMNSYRVGVAQAVAEQARAMVEYRDASVKESTALERRDRVQAAIAALKPQRLTAGRSSRLSSDAGYAAGQADGRTVQLRRSVDMPKNRMLGAAS